MKEINLCKSTPTMINLRFRFKRLYYLSIFQRHVIRSGDLKLKIDRVRWDTGNQLLYV